MFEQMCLFASTQHFITLPMRRVENNKDIAKEKHTVIRTTEIVSMPQGLQTSVYEGS